MVGSSKKISGAALLALKEALTHIYWTKNDLKLFVNQTINNKLFVNSLDFDKYKRQIAEDIVDRMSNRLDIFQDDLFLLIRAVSDMADFSHLKKWDDSEKKIKNAKEAVNALRVHTNGYFELIKEQEVVEKRKTNQKIIIEKRKFFSEKLDELNNEFIRMTTMTNKQKRGFDFEIFLNDLFKLFDLGPKCSYKADGEQIDGAFTHENQDYLLEAKWEDRPMPKSEIGSFSSKVGGKLKTTLGLFVAINGFSEECKHKENSNIILMDHQDILAVVDNRIDLKFLIYRKKQHASQTGNILFHPNE